MSRIKDKEDEPQHVLITGGSGFLGRKLLKRLKYFEKKIVITVLDSNVEDLEGIEVNKVPKFLSSVLLTHTFFGGCTLLSTFQRFLEALVMQSYLEM